MIIVGFPIKIPPTQQKRVAFLGDGLFQLAQDKAVDVARLTTFLKECLRVGKPTLFVFLGQQVTTHAQQYREGIGVGMHVGS